MPLKLEIPSLHLSLKYFIPDKESYQAQLDQLSLLDERCINVIEHNKIYQEHLKKVFNKKFQPHEFQVGDIILKENQQQSHVEHLLKDKFSPN